MHIFYSEYQNDYYTYTFSYCPYCVFETRDEIPSIYDSGFLPYTGDSKLHQYVYYMARSLRIPLQEFSLNSENRRVDRKFERFEIEKEWIPITGFDIHTLKKWCKADEEIKSADRFKQLTSEQVNQFLDKRGWS